MNEHPSKFRTDSLYVACYLMAKGAQFLKVEPIEEHSTTTRRYFYFVFDRDEKTDVLQQEFMNNADVPVGGFVNALNTLKGVIRANLGSLNRIGQ
jgi:hypothetical protein